MKIDTVQSATGLPYLENWPDRFRHLAGWTVVTMAVGYAHGQLYILRTAGLGAGGIIERYRGTGSAALSNDPFSTAPTSAMQFGKSAAEMLGLVHSHLIGMSFLFLVTAIVFACCRKPKGTLHTLIVHQAYSAHKITDGGFNPALAPLLRLWGFYGSPPNRRPKACDIDRALFLARTDQFALHSEGEDTFIQFQRPGVELNLDGIAVGYALDLGCVMLRSLGVEAALLELSGDFLALGSPGGAGWPITLLDGYGKETETVHLANQALATSANYATLQTLDGVTWGHIFNPVQGSLPPVRGSVTVIAATAATADAVSTGLYALSVEEKAQVISIETDTNLVK